MKGILFKEDMFQSVIRGRKKQTRRICKHQRFSHSELSQVNQGIYLDSNTRPRYKAGEVVYLKEPYCESSYGNGFITEYKFQPSTVIEPSDYTWQNKMFMPESAARYFILITKVRCERVQEISPIDAIDEGILIKGHISGKGIKEYGGVKKPGKSNELSWFLHPSQAYKYLWISINGEASWLANPWVWVYEFELTTKP